MYVTFDYLQLLFPTFFNKIISRWDIKQIIFSHVLRLGLKQNADSIDRHYIPCATDVHRSLIIYTGFYLPLGNSLKSSSLCNAQSFPLPKVCPGKAHVTIADFARKRGKGWQILLNNSNLSVKILYYFPYIPPSTNSEIK